MPNPSEDYICPQCNYSTKLKKRMKAHFYEKKKPCPNRTGVLLTDEIKNSVIMYHQYMAIKANSVINQTINNHNILNNFVSGLDMFEKMKILFAYQDTNQIDFEDDLEKKFEYRVKRLEHNEYRGGYYLNHDNILKLVDSVTKTDVDHLERFNILYNRAVNRFQIYRGEKWESYLEEFGVKELVSLIKSYFLDAYETYLIRNLHCDNKKLNDFELKDHIKLYYQFISVFDLTPTIADKNDIEILGHRLKDNDDFTLSDKYMKIFRDEKTELKAIDKNKIKRAIINIIKENTVHNINELNKKILELLKIDMEFKKLFITEGYTTPPLIYLSQPNSTEEFTNPPIETPPNSNGESSTSPLIVSSQSNST